jgi:hypothetical protein
VTTDHPLSRRALVLLVLLCFWLVGCELEETLTFNADGSGTYVARILIDKQFAGAVGDIKSKATSEGYRIVAESETPDRKVLVISKDFRDVSELSDKSDSYGLRRHEPSKWQRTYSLDFRTRSSTGNGIQKRTMKVVFPMAITSSTTGTVTGHEVVWDATQGGSLHVEAAGVLLPFGLTPIRTSVAVAVAGGALLLLLRRRRGPQACSSCRELSAISARFCGSCGAKLIRARSFSPTAAAVVVAALAVFGVVMTNVSRLSALFDRVTTNDVTAASAVPSTPPEIDATDTTAVAATPVSAEIVARHAASTALPQGVFQGTVVGLDVVQLDSGMRIELSGNQDGGCPFYGADHSGDVAWDIRVGDRLEVDGNVFPFTEENKWSMTPKAPFGVLANRITIVSQK